MSEAQQSEESGTLLDNALGSLLDEYYNIFIHRLRREDLDADAADDLEDRLFDLMKLEHARLRTFQIPGRWQSEIPAIELANTGFFCLSSTHIMCAFCRGVIINLRRTEREAIGEHAFYFPRCPFIMNEDVGNIPIDVVHRGRDVCGNGEILYRPVHHKRYMTVDARKCSFYESGWQSSVNISVIQLAEAGFFSIGKDDYVKCFSCDGGLCNWEDNDDPWIEHAKFFPDCVFVRLNKGDEFINDCKNSTITSSPISIPFEKLGLNDRLICKICYDREIGAVLTPCGHQMACTQCVLCLSECPICRKSIRGCVRTFFS